MNTFKSIALVVLTAWALLFAAAAQAAPISVKDDIGLTVVLPAPASRIVALSPSVVEVTYAAGAGDKIVATVEYSDYPASALKIPRVGGHSKIDLEAVIAAKPDLVIAWQSGNSPSAIEKIRQLGIPVYISQPHKMTDELVFWPAQRRLLKRPHKTSGKDTTPSPKNTVIAHRSLCSIKCGKTRSLPLAVNRSCRTPYRSAVAKTSLPI